MPSSDPDEAVTPYIRRPALSATVEETETGTECTIFDPRGSGDPAEATRWIRAGAGGYVEAAAIR